VLTYVADWMRVDKPPPRATRMLALCVVAHPSGRGNVP
jgi:hypothetical protein